jgi:hypothetical protein
MTSDIVQVKPVLDYCLEMVFENGERRWFDMKPLLSSPAFSVLTEQNLFMKAYTSMELLYGTMRFIFLKIHFIFVVVRYKPRITGKIEKYDAFIKDLT